MRGPRRMKKGVFVTIKEKRKRREKRDKSKKGTLTCPRIHLQRQKRKMGGEGEKI